MLLERLHNEGVPDVYRIARELRIKVKEEDLEGCEGLLIRPKGVTRGIIAIKRGIRSDGRKRFTIAHEIGHYILPGHDERASICSSDDIEDWRDRSNSFERDADDFAAELLIPTAVVKAHQVRTSPSLSAIESIASECGASFSATGWRYCDVTSEPCAIVWSERGKISWSRASTEFPFFILNGKVIEKESFAYDCFKREKVPDHPQPVPASAWIDSFNLIQGSQIHEESRSLPSYESVLTLLWIKSPIQRRSDYHEADEEALDPNEFTVYRKKWPK